MGHFWTTTAWFGILIALLCCIGIAVLYRVMRRSMMTEEQLEALERRIKAEEGGNIELQHLTRQGSVLVDGGEEGGEGGDGEGEEVEVHFRQGVGRVLLPQGV
ncbi:hypothetical protein B484DRAFT_452739 [Ochromonadaceae sp. CCMP2298]|nr:hypothetical protein B484DRAFT_452739 [Ochromonadaceae sp. CCMP2298]